MMEQLQFDFEQTENMKAKMEDATQRVIQRTGHGTGENLDLFHQALMGSLEESGWAEVIADEALTLACMVIRKNMDYGSSVFQSPILAPDMDVDTGIRVRMSDKIQRIENLMDGKRMVDESMTDTMRDLAGYAILWLVNDAMRHG